MLSELAKALVSALPWWREHEPVRSKDFCPINVSLFAGKYVVSDKHGDRLFEQREEVVGYWLERAARRHFYDESGPVGSWAVLTPDRSGYGELIGAGLADSSLRTMRVHAAATLINEYASLMRQMDALDASATRRAPEIAPDEVRDKVTPPEGAS